MEEDIYFEKLTCCSLELHWKDKNNIKNSLNSYVYELYRKEGEDNFFNFSSFEKIYKGKNNNYEIINLKPNTIYTFKLTVMKGGKLVEEKKISIKTLIAPSAILSEYSMRIANGEKIKYTNKLFDYQKRFIKNCIRLIFEKTNENIVKGDFNGIEIKIGHDIDSNIYYISFDIMPDYFQEFFNKFIEESENNLITPCHFIIQKLPTMLIFNLLKKGPIILTGKRMGGVIASSLAFYILYQGKLMNINYDNSFLKREKNCISIVTFSSPSFLTNLTAAIKMEGLASYFYNIKEEYDYMPGVIDFINKKQNYNVIRNLLQKMELENKDINIIKDFFNLNNFTEENIKNNINKVKKIPFGNYIMIKESDLSLISIDEYRFNEFFYFNIFKINRMKIQNLYKNLVSKIKFNKDSLKFLEEKNYQLDFIKIIRRNLENDSIKGIIKFKLDEIEHHNITPDIISKIKLISNTNKYYIITDKDIYYENNNITAYIDNLNENIKEIIIINNFDGEMKAKKIINIQGAGLTRYMLMNNIEKLFILPFSKLIRIFYDSFNNIEKYQNLKKQNFGENFDDLKILKPFEKQIQTINELLFLSRPDVLGHYEKEFIKEYIQDIKDRLTNEQMIYFNDKLKNFYYHAIQIQIEQKVNCLDSAQNSIAKKIPFPQNKYDDKEIKKLFMCKRIYFEDDNFITEKFDDSYIKNFYIENLIKESLAQIEKIIQKNLNDKIREYEFKDYFERNIMKFYNQIIHNIYFALILIISSIESGDFIKFKNKPIFSISFKEKRELINMENLYNKNKIKNITNINISYNNFIDLKKYLDKQIIGKKYYSKFLGIFSKDNQEDIEISIYDNFKRENNKRNSNFLIIKEIVNNLMDDEESKKGFLALVRQSYLLGKLRTNIVSIYLF